MYWFSVGWDSAAEDGKVSFFIVASFDPSEFQSFANWKMSRRICIEWMPAFAGMTRIFYFPGYSLLFPANIYAL
jgi:hypothetical protein